MGTLRHPKNSRICAFCNLWIGDAKLEFRSMSSGYMIDTYAKGKCMLNNSDHSAISSCSKFEPSIDAKKLL